MPDWKSLVRRLPEAARLDDDVVEEIAQHAEELFAAARTGGASVEEAEARAASELTRLHDVVRATRAARRPRPPLPDPAPSSSDSAVAAIVRDLAYGVRLLFARPAFSAVAVLTLALGIGANTAIFGVVNTLLLQPLPFPHADRLVMLWEASATDPKDAYIVSAPNYQDWVRQSTSFEQAAIWEGQAFNVAGDGAPEQVRGMRVSASAFAMLGVPPRLGRVFTEAEDLPGHDVAVISDGLWQQRFGGRPDVIGQRLRLNGRPFEVIGVMPPSFRFTDHESAVWVPIQFTEQDRERGAHSFLAAARLKQGVTFAAASSELEAIARRLEREYPANRGELATMTPMSELGVIRMQDTLYTLVGAVSLVLLIACVNVANLLLAQGSVRQREFAVRAALGASRARLLSQVIAEGIVLGAAGAAAGVLVAWVGTAALSSVLPAGVRFAPFRDTSMTVLDPVVLAFTAGLGLATGVLFSLAPAVGARAGGQAGTLKDLGTRGSTTRMYGLRSALLALQVGLAVVVLAAAGLLVKSMSKLVAVDPGLDPGNVLVLGMALPQPDTYGPPVRTSFCADVDQRVGGLPGIQSASAISHLPLSGASAGRGFVIEGRPQPAPNEWPQAAFRVTCPGYFTTLGIPILRGRDFSHSDTAEAPLVAIINKMTADAYWPGQDPVGRRIKGAALDSDAPWITVVGVVADVRHFGLDAESRREMFRPYSQRSWPSMTVTVKGSSDPRPLIPSIRAALAAIDPEQPILGVRTMQEVVDESLGSRTFPMLLLAVFSVVALALAAIGVYGVVSYLVSQRTREIGIRVALGARPQQVTWLIVRRSLLPVVAGILAGIAGALMASRMLGALLYNVTPRDPAVLAGIVAILATCAIAACLVPARRAAHVDPLIALRQE
jgi:predicted permease